MAAVDLTKEKSNVIDEFHSIISKVLIVCERIEPNNMDIMWLRKKISLAKEVDPLLVIDRAKVKIWEYREQIVNKDEDFFLKNRFEKHIKNDENKTFMYTLVNLVKNRFRERSDEEKEYIWSLCNKLLVAVIQYYKITAAENA